MAKVTMYVYLCLSLSAPEGWVPAQAKTMLQKFKHKNCVPQFLFL